MKASYLIWAYLAIALLFAIFGGVEGRAFSYNLGRGLMWPAIMFPSLGKVVTGLLVIAMVAFVTMAGRK